MEASASERKSWLLDAEAPPSLKALEGEGEIREERREAVWTRGAAAPIRAQRIEGRWMLTAGVLDTRSAATVPQALVLLLRALRERDDALFLALLPKEERSFWSTERARELLSREPWRSEVSSFVESMVALGARARRQESGGVVTLGKPGGQIILTREEEGWRIRDLRPHERFRHQSEVGEPDASALEGGGGSQ